VSAQSPELQSKIAIWRAKAAEGTLTQEEMREAIAALRGDRKAAQNASESSTKRVAKAKAAIPDADSLLDELG
jgi:hypothetical protein